MSEVLIGAGAELQFLERREGTLMSEYEQRTEALRTGSGESAKLYSILDGISRALNVCRSRQRVLREILSESSIVEETAGAVFACDHDV